MANGGVSRRVFVAGGICVSTLWSPAFAQPPWERYSAPPVGTTWTNEFRYSGSFRGPAEVASRMGRITWNGQPHVAFHNGPVTLVAREDGALVTLLGADGKQLTSWDPPMTWGWPLDVGRTWKVNFNSVNHANNNSVPVEASFVVEAFEDVQVKAGTFKAYRVRMTNNIGEETVWWFCPDNGLFVKQRLVRSDKSPSGAGTRESELTALSVSPPK
jgi:hypothetical protein